jgi:hypothetical protein
MESSNNADNGDGDWGLGIGDWGLGPIPNPQSPNFYDFNKNSKILPILKHKNNLLNNVIF